MTDTLTTDVHALDTAAQLPPGWSLDADNGMSFQGMRALDFWAVLRGDRVLIGNGNGIAYSVAIEPPDHWGDGYAAFVRHVIETEAPSAPDFAVPEGQQDTLAELLTELQDLSVTSSFNAALLDYVKHGNGDLPLALRELIEHMRGYLHLTDIDHIIAVLAAGAAQSLSYDPLWFMLIGASSGGKNEALRTLRVCRNANMKDVTLAGLLGKGGTGLLPKLGNACDALVTIEDFSALLTDPTQSAPQKTEVFNAFRDIYDGEYSRMIHPKELTWSGRISFVAACTPAIDQYAKHMDALGTRWLYFRMVERDSAERRLAASQALDRSGIGEKRQHAAELAALIIREAQERLPSLTLPEDMHETILDDANLAAYGRAVVPRAWNGEVDAAAFPEEPGRITSQLRSLSLGLLALGVSESVALRIVHRAAMSSMPHARALVLEALTKAAEPVSQRWTRSETRLSDRPCKRALEDWAALGFVSNISTSETVEAWMLAPEHEHVVRAVYGTAQEVIA